MYLKIDTVGPGFLAPRSVIYPSWCKEYHAANNARGSPRGFPFVPLSFGSRFLCVVPGRLSDFIAAIPKRGWVDGAAKRGLEDSTPPLTVVVLLVVHWPTSTTTAGVVGYSFVPDVLYCADVAHRRSVTLRTSIILFRG